MPVSLRDAVKKRILLDSFKSVQSPGKWKVLVVEESALRILNSVCELHDLADVSVPVTETLTAVKRTPYPDKDAIYLITPTQECVATLIQDFSGSEPMYAGAHIFCIAALPDDLFDQIKRSPARRRIYTLKEINVDFTPFESQVFHLNDPDAFLKLHDAYDFAKAEQQMSKMAEQMKSIFWTLEDHPTIRYFDATGEGASLSAHMAFKLEDAIAELKEIDPEWPPENSYPQSQIIVLDRTVDTLTPILHSLTYQAAVHDLLQVEGTKVSYIKTDANDKRDKHTAVIDELDPVYLIMELKKKLDSDGMDNEPSNDAIRKIEALKAKLFALPEAQKQLEKIVVHIHLYGEVMQAVADRQLDVIAGFQQTIATGEAPNSEKVPDSFYNDLMAVMEDPNLMPADKLRLILVYAAGFHDADPHRLAGVAQLGIEADAIMGLDFVTNKRVPDELRERLARYTDAGRKRDARQQQKKKAAEIPEEQVPFDIHRYAPVVKYILQDAVAGKLDAAIFPSTSQRAGLVGTGLSSKLDVSATTIGRGHLVPFRGDFQPTWAKKKPSSGQDGQANVDLRANGGRIIVLFVDGLSFAEIRAAYEVTRERGREIFIGKPVHASSEFTMAIFVDGSGLPTGSTHIMTPIAFVEDLLQLGGTGAGPAPIPPVQHKLLKQHQPQPAAKSEVSAISAEPEIKTPAYSRPTESAVASSRSIFKHPRPEPIQRSEPAVSAAPFPQTNDLPASVSEKPLPPVTARVPSQSSFSESASLEKLQPPVTARASSQSSISGSGSYTRPSPLDQSQRGPTPDSSSESLSHSALRADASQHTVKPAAPARAESAEMPLTDLSSETPLRRPKRVESNRSSRSFSAHGDAPGAPSKLPQQAPTATMPPPAPMTFTSSSLPPRTKSRGQPVVAPTPTPSAANPAPFNVGGSSFEMEQSRRGPEDYNVPALAPDHPYSAQPVVAGLHRSHRISYSGPPPSHGHTDGRASQAASHTPPLYPQPAPAPLPSNGNSNNMPAPPTYSESSPQYYVDSAPHPDFKQPAPPTQYPFPYTTAAAAPTATPAYPSQSSFAPQPQQQYPSSRPVYRQAAYRQAAPAFASSSSPTAYGSPTSSYGAPSSPLYAGSPPYGQHTQQQQQYQQHPAYLSAIPPPASRYVQAPAPRSAGEQRAPSPAGPGGGGGHQQTGSARPDPRRYHRQ
ncbi:Syntaxin-binding protein 1 [Geranomyces variabilis]|uniref:Syntaxin-binding protein 1 n=1 Tax=Geranomyces variabilis TaxID=109894 RepID=A0AAD5XV42_9FUNG|nr:Syntaxin-binding protein 1 [Geranomyces variabilis]